MTCGIYKITCNETGRNYIGQSTNIEVRWKKHHKRFPPLAFTYSIVATCLPEPEVLDCLEKFCIADFKAKWLGFNLTKGGNGAWASIKQHSEETKQKIANAKKGKPGKQHSEETKQKMSNSQKGRGHSEETKQKMSEAKKGKPKSDETKRKMSESKLGSIPWNKGRKKTDGNS